MRANRFYVGLHQPSDAFRFSRCCINVERLLSRVKLLGCQFLLLDSRAFNQLRLFGAYQMSTSDYARVAERIADLVRFLMPVTQDYPCEPFVLRRTGLTVRDHQRLTIERYDDIRRELRSSLGLMPVLQGYLPDQYVAHLYQWGGRLHPRQWVGVGSVCRRNGSPREIAAVLRVIKREAPDLRLHGFGIKKTALASEEVRSMLYSADSLAWSFAARKQGRNANDWNEARLFAADVQDRVSSPLPDLPMFPV